MKVLLDEMYTGFKPHLTALGWDVITAEEAGIKSKSDLEVVEYAMQNGFTLVSQEQRVADLARLKGVTYVVIGTVDVARIIDQKLRAL